MALTEYVSIKPEKTEDDNSGKKRNREMSKELIGDQAFVAIVDEYNSKLHGQEHRAAPLRHSRGLVLLSRAAGTACNELASCMFKPIFRTS